jgi:predicted nucleic acid-binding protein
MRVFLDANVLFSAAYNSNGRAAFLLGFSDEFAIVSSEYAIEEARRNIQVKKASSISTLEELISLIDVVADVAGNCPIKLPPKDQPIFLSALRVKATHLLTGDLKDFGPFMNRPEKSGGILIQTVADFFAALAG